MIEPLLTTKFNIPQARRQVVERPHLIEHLNRGQYGKLTLIIAAVGSGKTTLLAKWLSQGNFLATWLTLDNADNYIIRFLRYLIHALQQIHKEIGKTSLQFLTAAEPRPLELILTTLINEISQYAPNHFVVILDDYQFIQNPEIHQILTFLIDYLPPHMHLVLASHAKPPFPLAKWRAKGELTEIMQLNFNEMETQQFLRDIMKLSLSDPEIQTLNRQSEGWITGLQLAALAMQHQHKAEVYIFDYLAEEVLARQPEAIHDFLLKTAVFDQFSTDLCNTVLAIDNSVICLQYLEKNHLFMAPLDVEWYRYHRLFRDFLYKQLQKTYPDLLKTLHERASAWYAAHGFTSSAIHHAFQSQNYDQVVQLLEPELHYVWLRTEMPTLLSWLDQLPQEILLTRPQLCLTYAWGMLFSEQYERIEKYLESAERQINTQPLAIQHQAKVLHLRVLAYQGKVEEAIEGSLELLDSLDESASFIRGKVLQDLGRYYQDGLAALNALQEAATLFESKADICEMLITLDQVAHLQLLSGQLHAAQKTYNHILATEWHGAILSATIHAHLGLSRLYHEWNNSEKATFHAQQATELSQKSGQPALQITTLYEMLKGQPEKFISVEIVRLIDRAIETQKPEYLVKALELGVPCGFKHIFAIPLLRKVAMRPSSVQEYAVTILTEYGENFTEESTLTNRELAVLRLVAAGLSNQEIATTLVVSVGTAKKHLNNIFSKLNAQNRTQAVARARELNLL